MLHKLGSPDTVLAVEVVGKLEKDDYRTVLVPGLDELLERHGEIRCVIVFGDEYAGIVVADQGRIVRDEAGPVELE